MSNKNEPLSRDRRDVVRKGGAAAFGAIAAWLPAGVSPVRAEALAQGAPVIDRLTVSVVIDSYQIAVAPDVKVGNVTIKRFGFALSDRPPNKAMASEFGLSLHAASQSGSETRNVLIDFGYTPGALNNNIALLALDPSKIDALVLSHGHYDHFGGLVGFLNQNKGTLKAKLPIFLGGEECFCARQWLAPPTKGDFGALDRSAMQDADLALMFSEGPALVADQGFTTGKVDLASFEKVLSPTTMKIGRVGAIGCYPEAFAAEEREKGSFPDQFRHEIGTAYNLKGRGLIVPSSCSHRRIVNIVKQAQAVSGVSKIHAIIGGFHLAPFKDDYVREVVSAINSADGWEGVLKPVVARYRGKLSRIYFRADAGFANPEVYEHLEGEGIKFAIRLPRNNVLQKRIGYLLKRPVGGPSLDVRRSYANFTYQVRSWTKPRRVVAKVEWHPGELYPRVGFIVTNMARPAENVVAFYNKRGTCEQWIKEGKGAIRWTRLSCPSFSANAVRLQLHALAYNLGNFLRTLATPDPIKDWSLTSLKEKLIKIGAKVVSHGRCVAFQMAEVAIPRNLFADVLRLIAELRPPPVTSTA